MKKNSDFEDSQEICVSGTLDTIALYMVETFGLDKQDAVKVVTLLWLKENLEYLKTINADTFTSDIKSLDEFDVDGMHAKGMVANSRFFLNFSKARIEALKSVPFSVVKSFLSGEITDLDVIVSLFEILSKAVIPNIQYIQEGLTCVCMLAWKATKGNLSVSFRAEDIIPKEDPLEKRRICEFDEYKDEKKFGNAKWICYLNSNQNYCNITEKNIEDVLRILAENKVLKPLPDGSYRFL